MTGVDPMQDASGGRDNLLVRKTLLSREGLSTSHRARMAPVAYSSWCPGTGLARTADQAKPWSEAFRSGLSQLALIWHLPSHCYLMPSMITKELPEMNANRNLHWMHQMLYPEAPHLLWTKGLPKAPKLYRQLDGH